MNTIHPPAHEVRTAPPAVFIQPPSATPTGTPREDPGALAATPTPAAHKTRRRPRRRR